MPERKTLSHYPRAHELPEVCPTCGQKIDRNSRYSIEHHATPKHLPYVGKKRVGWR